MENNPLHKELHKLRLADFSDHELVTVKVNQLVETAVKVMAEKRILSTPVLSANGKEVVGLVDILDIINYIAKVQPDDQSLSANELKSLEVAGRAIAMEEIGNIINASNRDPYIPLHINNPVVMALDMFAEGIHRVVCASDDGNIVSSVSQSNIVNWMANHLKEGAMEDMASLTVNQLGLSNKPVISINLEDTVLAAVDVLNEKGVSALAVISDTGRLVGNYSASDVVGLYKDQFPSFLLTVNEFLEQHSPNSMNPICVEANTSLGGVVKEMVESKVHRVWVVDGDYKPVSVISMTDLMRVIRDYKL